MKPSFATALLLCFSTTNLVAAFDPSRDKKESIYNESTSTKAAAATKATPKRAPATKNLQEKNPIIDDKPDPSRAAPSASGESDDEILRKSEARGVKRKEAVAAAKEADRLYNAGIKPATPAPRPPIRTVEDLQKAVEDLRERVAQMKAAAAGELDPKKAFIKSQNNSSQEQKIRFEKERQAYEDNVTGGKAQRLRDVPSSEWDGPTLNSQGTILPLRAQTLYEDNEYDKLTKAPMADLSPEANNPEYWIGKTKKGGEFYSPPSPLRPSGYLPPALPEAVSQAGSPSTAKTNAPPPPLKNSQSDPSLTPSTKPGTKTVPAGETGYMTAKSGSKSGSVAKPALDGTPDKKRPVDYAAAQVKFDQLLAQSRALNPEKERLQAQKKELDQAELDHNSKGPGVLALPGKDPRRADYNREADILEDKRARLQANFDSLKQKFLTILSEMRKLQAETLR